MIEIHRDLLWIGNAMDIRSPEKLFDAEISAVVDVAYEELPAQLPRQLIYCRFPINDGGGNDRAVLRQPIQTIADLLDAGLRTIVGCSAGMSRSPTFATAALSVHLTQPPDKIIARIAPQLRSLDVSSRLWSDVVEVVAGIRPR